MFGWFKNNTDVGLLERRGQILASFKKIKDDLAQLANDLGAEANYKRDQAIVLTAEADELEAELKATAKTVSKLEELLS